jgi:hypothetical protein
MINHGSITAYLDPDAAKIRNDVLAASGSVSNFGELNTAWKNLNRCLNLSSSVEKYVATTTNGYEFLAALSQSILAITTSDRIDTQITSSVGSGGGSSTLRPILCPDGTIYCPPYGATNAGYYYLPDTNQFFTASGQAAVAANQYVSAVLQPDGKVFCVPYSMTASRVFDPATKSVVFKGKFAGGGQFAGGVQLPNGKIFCNPYNGTRAIIWDPLTETSSSSDGLTYSGSAASHGCVLAANGKVYSIPFNATKVYVYDYRTNLTTTGSGTYAGSQAFLSGVLLPNGKIFFHPWLSTSARIYDPETDIVTTPAPTFPGTSGYLGSVLMLDGRVILIPSNQLRPGFYNYTTDTYSTGSVAWHAGTFGFYSGALMKNGKIFACGYNHVRNEIFTPNYVSASSTLALSTFLNKA